MERRIKLQKLKFNQKSYQWILVWNDTAQIRHIYTSLYTNSLSDKTMGLNLLTLTKFYLRERNVRGSNISHLKPVL